MTCSRCVPRGLIVRVRIECSADGFRWVIESNNNARLAAGPWRNSEPIARRDYTTFIYVSRQLPRLPDAEPKKVGSS